MINHSFTIGWERLVVLSEFGAYEKLIKSTQENIENAHKEVSQSLVEHAASSQNPDDIEDIHNRHAEQHLELAHFNDVLMHSLFVASISLFEFRFGRICARAQRFSGNPIGLSDLGNFSMSRAKNHLTKLEVQVPAASDEWREATRFYKIRNKIVHEGGRLNPQDNLALYANAQHIVHHWAYESKPEGDAQLLPLQLHLHQTYCEKALLTLKQLLVMLSDVCDDNWPNVQ